MKKLLVALAFFLATGIMQAQDFNRVDVSSDVVVSTSAWTLVPTVGNSRFRSGIVVDNYASNTASMLMIFTNSTTPPTISTGTGLTIRTTDKARLWEARDKVYLWLVSLHTAAENIFYQELKK